ncbi:MAG: quinoprotein dehydrogenase-associated SoxYZ-like carrier [Azospirillum sp.]|nr:quinoprotein dehydrogenase-associated SoxYZ-like carrier [Azospirillum sp.]
MIVLTLAAVLLLPAASRAQDAEDLQRWDDLKALYFPGKSIIDAGDLLSLEAPTRAEDAALVPLAITPHLAAAPGQLVEKLWLLVDANPVPLVGQFRFGTAAATGDLAIRVRVNDYTLIHAVAELSDGRLLATQRYVKASGGCSAPASKDPEAAMARLGRMKLNLPERLISGEAVTAQLLISHPNHTGMQFDQITRSYVPAHNIRSIKITWDGKPLLAVDADISLSEDPSIHFSFIPTAPGTLAVEADDSKDNHFTAQWPVVPAPGS